MAAVINFFMLLLLCFYTLLVPYIIRESPRPERDKLSHPRCGSLRCRLIIEHSEMLRRNHKLSHPGAAVCEQLKLLLRINQIASKMRLIPIATSTAAAP